MCGVGGIILAPGRASLDLDAGLAAMADAMQHRGPDDRGRYLSPDRRAGLVSRRLAIRDLSPSGHMPMGAGEGGIWITYNGEIYNTDELRPELERLGYVFRSEGDTEVILLGYAAWGEAVVGRLRGMFALGILDLRPEGRGPRLFLARDRLGIKPLYYARAGGAFSFASELRALLATGLVGREPDEAGLAGYLLLGAVPNPLTIYRDIRALEPGCTLTIPLDRALDSSPAPVAYWSPPTETVAPASPEEAIARVRALLAEAVRIRLVSDVPLGAFLSGGIDSSAVVALMRRATDGPIRTCSMAFEEAEYSEARYARAMAESVGAEHHERVVTAADLAGELDHILGAMDQPTIDGVNTYFVSQTAREAGLTVALSGLGGDELFGGYPNTFAGVPQMRRTLAAARTVPGGAAVARGAIALLPNRPRWAKVHDALGRPPSPASAYLTRRGLFAPGEVRALLGPERWHEAARRFDPVRHIDERAGGLPLGEGFATQAFAWTSRAELRTYTHHQLLRDTDVMSMAHSLEVRVPLLDHRLVEAVLRLPGPLKARGRPKSLLLDALGDDLPALIRAPRPKQGFTFPFDRWLRGPLRATIGDLLSNVAEAGVIRPDEVRRIWREFQDGKLHWSRVWALVVLRDVSRVAAGKTG